MTRLALQPAPPRLTYLQMVLRDTLRGVGPRVGLAWLVVLTFLAVFAPFLANSYPYAVRTTDGSLSFPLFRYLRPVDVALPVMTLLALLAWRLFGRVPARWRLLVWVLASSAVCAACFLTIKPPLRQTYDRYREQVKQGEVIWAITTPIPYSPSDRLSELRFLAPSASPWRLMGTEGNGADVFSRMVHASRIAMAIGLIATSIALVIGVIVGGLMGYFSGIVDLIGMRLVEIFAAVPTFFLLLILVAVMPPEWNPYKLYVMMVIIGITGWVGYARFVRAEFLRLREQDFVTSARACGLPLSSILFRHMLPNGMAPVLVEASFGVAGAILAESTLSFLGLGLVDQPSWGQMLSESISGTGSFKWWMAFFPGMAIFLTVFAYNLVGESLRDAIDPHTRKVAAL
ncbi:MAG: ABC transporter permease subunit [Phycisphaera sp.]|nr:ABC transporter permease subunit [Phycisphaera sp.]